MSVQVVVTTGKEDTHRQAGLVRRSDSEAAQNAQVNINELITSVFNSVRGSLEKEAEVEMEISGNLTLSGKGNDTVLIFDVSGENSNARTLRIKLNTKIQPEDKK